MKSLSSLADSTGSPDSAIARTSDVTSISPVVTLDGGNQLLSVPLPVARDEQSPASQIHLMDTLVSQIMTPKEQLVTVKEGTELDEVKELLHRHRIEKVLVVK